MSLIDQLIRRFRWWNASRELQDELVEFYEDLQEIVRTGQPLADFFEQMAATSRRRKSDQYLLFQYTRTQLEKGRPFTDAARTYLPKNDLIVLRAGERTGNLSEALKNVVETSEAVNKIRAMIRGAVIGPLLKMSVLAVLFYVLTYELIPSLTFIVPLDSWGIAFRGVYYSTHFVVGNWWFFLPVLGGLFYWTMWSMSNLRDSRFRSILNKMAPWSIYGIYVSATSLVSLSGLMRSGEAFHDVFVKVAEYSSPYAKSHLSRMSRLIANGAAPSRAMDTGFFPVKIVDRLQRYEQSGKFNERMMEMGSSSIHRTVTVVEKSVTKAVSIFNLIFYVVVGLIGTDFAKMATVVRSVMQTQH